jgi:hypothetical protein
MDRAYQPSRQSQYKGQGRARFAGQDSYVIGHDVGNIAAGGMEGYE